jgi:Icc-related predicted phosphoesterase
MGVSSVVRVGALADLHYRRSAQGELVSLLGQAAQICDVLLLPGDLTDRGTVEEAQLLARDLAAAVKIPVLAVLGNHDFESDIPGEVTRILADAGIVVLDGDAHEIHGIGFAGVKGFAGGFGKHALGSWGEPVIKQFVKEALDEALKLENALARLRTPQRIALIHYAPVPSTVEGEPPEIYTYLGSSRLEEPLSRYPVTAVFHGHAHRGAPEGTTTTGVPVYNVSLPLLQRLHPNGPNGPPVRVLEVAV